MIYSRSSKPIDMLKLNKFNENKWKQMKINEIQWNSMKFIGKGSFSWVAGWDHGFAKIFLALSKKNTKLLDSIWCDFSFEKKLSWKTNFLDMKKCSTFLWGKNEKPWLF